MQNLQPHAHQNPTVGRELQTALLWSLPLVALAEILERFASLQIQLRPALDGGPGIGRYIYYFAIAYFTLIPYLAIRVSKRANPLRLALGKKLLLSVPMAGVSLLPILVLMLGSAGKGSRRGLYLILTESWIGLWLAGGFMSFVAAIAMWVIASNFDTTNNRKT